MNRHMNETLEGIARALFKSWFVDFDPVCAKAEGRQPAGMDAATAALFPSYLADSALGKVPQGWRIAPIRTLVNMHRDLLNPLDFSEEVFDHYSIPAFDAGRVPLPEVGAAIKSSKFIVPRNSILLSKLNPRIPRVWLPFPDSNRRPVCSTEFLVCTPTSACTLEYLYSLFSSADFCATFTTLVTGTSGSHQRVKAESFL